MTAASRMDSRFRLSPALARDLAEKFGTPLYVLDEASFRGRIRRFVGAMRELDSRYRVAYASKANGTLALLAIAHGEGCLIDAASEGELRGALLAGVPARDCHLHGNNKSEAEIAFALSVGVGAIVIDHFGEIETLARLDSARSSRAILRLAPGVDPKTHAKISTGQSDTKFGFNIADGSAERALTRCLELGLNVEGFHCHVGSQLLDAEAQSAGGELLAQFAASMARRHGFKAGLINVGGGLGARYTDADEVMEIEDFTRTVCAAVRQGLEGSGLSPIIVQEPGRALIAESGLTLYRVGVVKTVPSAPGESKTYVSVDGGLSDNPRPALYGARYQAERIWPESATSAASMKVTVSGRHCETDTLIADARLPVNIAPGDLIQVLTTGAYGSSMASNYNRTPRPASVLIRENGEATLVQARESYEEMFAREWLPEDLRGRA